MLHCRYAYPPPDGNILTNIVNTLIAVPRFYTQVHILLHFAGLVISRLDADICAYMKCLKIMSRMAEVSVTWPQCTCSINLTYIFKSKLASNIEVERGVIRCYIWWTKWTFQHHFVQHFLHLHCHLLYHTLLLVNDRQGIYLAVNLSSNPQMRLESHEASSPYSDWNFQEYMDMYSYTFRINTDCCIIFGVYNEDLLGSNIHSRLFLLPL